MAEHKVDHALEDILLWGKVDNDAESAIRKEMQECVECHCEGEEIPLSQVDMKQTLDNIRVVATLVPMERE